ASGVQPLTQSFVGASGFAVGVSSDYVLSQIDIDAIRAGLDGQKFSRTLSGPFGISISVTYTLHFTSGPTAVFQSGGIAISGTVSLSGNKWWSPNASASFTQLIKMVLDAPNQQAILARVGDPDVSIDPSYLSWIFHDTAVNIVKSQFDTALADNTSKVRVLFSNARNMLLNGLRTFDSFANPTFTGIQITRDGLIVRGEIGSAAGLPLWGPRPPRSSVRSACASKASRPCREARKSRLRGERHAARAKSGLRWMSRFGLAPSPCRSGDRRWQTTPCSATQSPRMPAFRPAFLARSHCRATCSC